MFYPLLREDFLFPVRISGLSGLSSLGNKFEDWELGATTGFSF